VIGVVGKRGSGKGVLADVARSEGLAVFEMSDVVVERMLRTRMRIDNRSLRLFADGLRRRYGADFIARKTIERIRKGGKGRGILVAGIRSPAEVDAFRKAFGRDFILLALTAPLMTRWARVRRRGRAEDARSFGEFLWAERMERRWGIERAMEMADERMRNARGKREFEERATRRWLGKLLYPSSSQ